LAPKVKGIESRPDGANVAFLLIHGFLAAPDELQTFAQLLEEKGIAYFSVQLPGHGTKPEDLKGITWKDWFKAAQEALDYLQSWETKYVFLAGISMGGAISIMLASQNDGIDGMVLFAPAMKIDGILPKLVPVLKYVMKDREIDVVKVQEQYDVKRTKYAKEPVWIYHELFKLQKVARRQMEHVVIPTIIIHGTADKTINHKYGQLVYDSIKSEDKQIFLIEGGEHVIPCHHTRSEAYPHVKEFISRITQTD
jgi:carboxylesterase